MEERTRSQTTAEVPERPELENCTCYEEGDDLVICDRQNPKAWVKSDTTVSLSR